MGLKYVVKGVSVLKDINDLENIVVGFKQASATNTLPGTGQTIQASASVAKFLFTFVMLQP